MADTNIPSGHAAAVKRWGGKPPKDAKKPSKADPPARCGQFCRVLHAHVR